MKAREEVIVGQVRHALALEPGVDAPKIRISMIDAQLNLSGTLDDVEQVRLAEEVARRAAPGVPIENTLGVHMGPTGWQDSELGPRVAEAVRDARDRLGERDLNIGVEVRGGVAYLLGQCDTIEDRDSLIAAAGAVNGVKSVDHDRLIVAHFTDAARTASLALERLQAEAPDLAGAVQVLVHERSARLVGRLRSQGDRERVLEIVRRVPGIQTVHDELALYQAGEQSSGVDARLEQAVRRALGDAGLPVPDLAVIATEGAITLMGAVDSPEAHREAGRVARSVSGVTAVDNQLDIRSGRGNAPHPEGDRRQDIHQLPHRELGKYD